MKTKPTNKLKFETDNINLSDEQIAKHKNFDKLLADYQVATKPLYKTPLYKNKKVFLVVLVILLVVFVIVESVEKSETKIAPPQPKVEHSSTTKAPIDTIKKEDTAIAPQKKAIQQNPDNRVEGIKKDSQTTHKTVRTKIVYDTDFDATNSIKK